MFSWRPKNSSMSPSNAAIMAATRYSVEVSSDMASPNGCEVEFPARPINKYGLAPRTLLPPCWQSVCFWLQVFWKNCVNSSLKCARKKRPQAGASFLHEVPRKRQILTKLLALRELERPARLGATVLLAFDHARVAREKTTLFQDVSEIRLEKGQRLR